MNAKRDLMLLTIFAVGIGALVWAFRSTAPDQSLWLDVGKGAIQLIVLAGIGGLLKILVDNYQSEQQQRAKNQEFRKNKYVRLVDATNRLRSAPMRVNPDGSPRRCSIRMRDVFDVGLDLRMIKHQIYSSKDLKPPPLPKPEELAKLFELMYDFTGQTTKEFVDKQKEEGMQSLTPDPDPASPSIDIMLDDPPTDAVELEQELIERILSNKSKSPLATQLAQLAQERKNEAQLPSAQGLTWTTYLAAEGLALERITKATLGRRTAKVR